MTGEDTCDRCGQELNICHIDANPIYVGWVGIDCLKEITKLLEKSK
jgi:hypothetical protein